MPRVTITIEVEADQADPSDPTGLTEDAYLEITGAVGDVCAGVVDVTPA